MTVRQAIAELVDHPARCVIHRWHWKSTVMSAVIRSLLFFATNVSAGASHARRAAAVEFVLRLPMVGVLAAVAQTLRHVEPTWVAVLATAIALPLTAHAAEWLVHWSAGTPALGVTLLASGALSAVATTFTMFAMRRGVFIVGEESRPFRDDLGRLPGVIAAFLRAPIERVSRWWAKRRPSPRGLLTDDSMRPGIGS